MLESFQMLNARRHSPWRRLLRLRLSRRPQSLERQLGTRLRRLLLLLWLLNLNLNLWIDCIEIWIADNDLWLRGLAPWRRRLPVLRPKRPPLRPLSRWRSEE